MSKERKLGLLRASHLKSLAQSNGITKDENIITQLAEKLSEKTIDDYLEECTDGGNITSYAFRLTDKPDNFKEYILKVLDEKDLTKLQNIGKIKADSLTSTPSIYKITITDRYVKIFFYWKENNIGFITKGKDGYIEKCYYPRFNEGIYKIHFEKNLIEIRIRDDKMIEKVNSQIRTLFSFGLTKISYNDILDKIIDYAEGVSHTELSPQSENISTIGFTAKDKKKETKDLLDDQQYIALYRGSRLVAIHVNKYINDPYSPNSKIKVTFRVTKKGKVYFFSNVREKDIEYVIEELSRFA